jgi:hypothetical protein
MSIVAMNWVWQLKLKPSVKFVLLALADAADDSGYCWPSIKTIADKTNLDDRSVQRILSKLKTNNLVQIQKRFRGDGSPTSNSYLLPINNFSSGNLPPPNQTSCREVMDSVTPPDDTSVTQTTTEYINEFKPPQPNNFADCGGGNLTFPKQLSTKEVALAKIRLEQLAPELAQELLDELAGRLNANSVRSSPLSYLRSLVARAESGTFTPEAGVRVALARAKVQELAAFKLAAPPKIQQHTLDPKEQIQKLRKTISSPNNKPLKEA